jgi:hypothetical protein
MSYIENILTLNLPQDQTASHQNHPKKLKFQHIADHIITNSCYPLLATESIHQQWHQN